MKIMMACYGNMIDMSQCCPVISVFHVGFFNLALGYPLYC